MKKIIIFISLSIVFIDQFIKSLILNNMNLYDNIAIISNFFNIVFVKNDGGAFSIFPGSRWIFIVSALIVLFLFIKFIIKEKKCSKFELITYSIIIGGVIGNMIDRICYGSVIDYISFSLFGYEAPIFNFADVCIVIGAFMLCLIIMKGENHENNKRRK